MRRYARSLTSLLVLSGLLAIPAAGWAEREFSEPKTFDPKATYAVTYQISETESNTLQPVEVLGVVSLGLRSFLLVQVQGFGEKKAYLDLESIRSIVQQ